MPKFLADILDADRVNDTASTHKFTTAGDITKLAGIATNANNYIHPNGFTSQPGTALTDGSVISRVTVNGEGHVTGVTSRTLTAANIGAAATSHTQEITTITAPNWTYGINRFHKPVFDILRADRTAFLPADQIIVEQSIDAGTTWIDAGMSDSNKRKLFTGQRPALNIPLIGGIKDTRAMARITITGMKYTVPGGTVETDKYNYWNSTYVSSTERYCTLEEGWMWVSAVADRIWYQVERATGALPNSWTLVREGWMSGWSGGNHFSLDNNTFGGGTTQTGNGWNWRITFRTGTTSQDFDQAKMSALYASSGQSIYHIKLTGPNAWVMPNKMMYHDHLYGWDENQIAEFPSDIKTNGVLLVNTNDSRLTDARTPLAHTQAISTITNLQTELDTKASESFAIAMAIALG